MPKILAVWLLVSYFICFAYEWKRADYHKEMTTRLIESVIFGFFCCLFGNLLLLFVIAMFTHIIKGNAPWLT